MIRRSFTAPSRAFEAKYAAIAKARGVEQDNAPTLPPAPTLVKPIVVDEKNETVRPRNSRRLYNCPIGPKFVSTGKTLTRVAKPETSKRPGAESRRAINEIIFRCAQSHGVTIQDVLGDSRERSIVRARHQAIRLIFEGFQGRYSIATIGRIFNRDHTSIMHALCMTKAAKKLAAENGERVIDAAGLNVDEVAS